MASAVILGPTDHGKPLAPDEFMAGDYQEGFKYELVEGKLYVAPLPNLSDDRVEIWLLLKLVLYSREHPEVVNHVTDKARVFVPTGSVDTIPEADIAAYRNFPVHLPFQKVRWQDVSPLLVVEIVSADDPDKDLVRNVDLYLQVPSIKEYWILDARKEPERPHLLVYRRSRGKWRRMEVGPDEAYSTNLLPGFPLVMNARS
ncbi:MAG: Uma2 family endonuclease [Gemmataceae bacterium]